MVPFSRRVLDLATRDQVEDYARRNPRAKAFTTKPDDEPLLIFRNAKP